MCVGGVGGGPLLRGLHRRGPALLHLCGPGKKSVCVCVCVCKIISNVTVHCVCSLGEMVYVEEETSGCGQSSS